MHFRIVKEILFLYQLTYFILVLYICKPDLITINLK